MGKERISGDFSLGISQVAVQASLINTSFPQLPPQLLTNQLTLINSLVRKVICNYKKVISISHISTPVITTNFKYKYFGSRVPFNTFNLNQKLSKMDIKTDKSTDIGTGVEK